MRFPGKRKSKHYFPVKERGRIPLDFDFNRLGSSYIVGIDQPLVDVEINVTEEFLAKYNLQKGQSFLLPDQVADEIYEHAQKNNLIVGQFAGGAVGNTLHNYSVLSEDRSVLLGSISKNITVGDYAFKYICNTSTKVDLNYLQPVEGSLGRAFCFVTPDGERSFGISKGSVNDFCPDFLPEDIVAKASALLLTAFLFRDEEEQIYQAAMKAADIAKKNNIPVVLTLGTSSLVEAKHERLLDFVNENVTILAMNELEAKAFTGHDDPLLAGQWALDYVDVVLITEGERGLYLAAYVDEAAARLTKDALHSKSIAEYNKYEYSRAMKKSWCQHPVKIYSHINPYLGGPGRITNTNGAGDAALSALLHDIASNCYHREMVPNSPKHDRNFLTYSSISQICKYANRVSYEVLIQNSPRLSRGLPAHEDSLEETYWER